MMNEMLERVRP